MPGKSSVRLDWATHEAAKFACRFWHYSRCIPAGKLAKIGVWEEGAFVGAIVFSRGTCGHLFQRFGLGVTEGAELTRVALTKHKFQTSRAIAIALKMLKAEMPSLRLIVSFASKIEGHHGGIYQAGGWVYDGETSFKQEYLFRGRRVTDRSVSQMVRERKLARADLTKAPSDTKHRYFMPLDETMRAEIAILARQYPRPKQAMAGPPAQRRGSADLDAPPNEAVV